MVTPFETFVGLFAFAMLTLFILTHTVDELRRERRERQTPLQDGRHEP